MADKKERMILSNTLKGLRAEAALIERVLNEARDRLNKVYERLNEIESALSSGK